MICPNCNRVFNDDFDFCPYCGAKKPETLTCPKCGFRSNEYSFCPKCGIKLLDDERLKKNRKDERQRKAERKRKRELIKIVEETDLDPSSKSNLIAKINQTRIMDEHELRDAIRAEKKKILLNLVKTSALSPDEKEFLNMQIEDNWIDDKEYLIRLINDERELKDWMLREEKSGMYSYISQNHSLPERLQWELEEAIEADRFKDLADLKRRLPRIIDSYYAGEPLYL